jgi:alpha-galactosidase
MDLAAFQHLPSDVRLFRDDTPAVLPMQRRGTDWIGEDVTASLSPGLMSTSIRVHAPHSAVSRVAVRWAMTFPQTTLFLGDAWERAYGDLQWRSMQSERVLPWYLAAHDPVSGQGLAVGVKTQPAAMCFWTADPGGVSLWLDLRNGGCACVPGDRWIDAATVVGVGAEPGQTLTALIRRLCTRMCDAPRAVAAPVCGNNNWYYAYGQNFDADQVRRDAALLAELAGDAINRPYCVIDAGWSPGSSCPGGPFTAGRPGKFPSMPRLAEDIGKTGVRAGIWIRPTALTVIDNPNRPADRGGETA